MDKKQNAPQTQTQAQPQQQAKTTPISILEEDDEFEEFEEGNNWNFVHKITIPFHN